MKRHTKGLKNVCTVLIYNVLHFSFLKIQSGSLRRGTPCTWCKGTTKKRKNKAGSIQETGSRQEPENREILVACICMDIDNALFFLQIQCSGRHSSLSSHGGIRLPVFLSPGLFFQSEDNPYAEKKASLKVFFASGRRI